METKRALIDGDGVLRAIGYIGETHEEGQALLEVEDGFYMPLLETRWTGNAWEKCKRKVVQLG